MPRDDFLIPSSDGVVELTTNAVAYQIPATADVLTVPQEVVIFNPSTASIYIRATTGTSSGRALAQNGSTSVRLAPSQKVYGYSAVALQTVNYSVFKIA